jgi:hypothetical protein
MPQQLFNPTLIEWLLEGDISIQYQVYRNLLNIEKPDIKERISTEGWGAKYLSLRKNNGHWGISFYQPKWISTHYTLLDIRNLCFPNHHSDIQFSVNKILNENKGSDGGINPSKSLSKSDVCVNGMFLNYASYFGANEDDLKSVIDYVLSQQLPDGGFNCHYNRIGARHSSLHSTLSIAEGIQEYVQKGYKYRVEELKKAEKESRAFMLEHKLFKSHRTGEIIDRKMLMLSYPSRWRYDILRALDYFRYAGVAYDERMADAIEILLKKQREDKKWPLQARHSGQSHFEMEITGKASRWNTMRALRVLEHFGMINGIKEQTRSSKL